MDMDIRAVQTEADYDWALAEIASYFESEPELGSLESERFMVLTALIGAYESKYWKIEAPDPIDAITIFLADHHRSRRDLAALLGSQSRVSEILNRKRRLTLSMVHKLATHWHLPADLLVRPYHLDGGPYDLPGVARGRGNNLPHRQKAGEKRSKKPVIASRSG